MTEDQRGILDKALPGLRLIFFEFMWPPFRWIRNLWIRERDGHYELFAEVHDMQDQTKLDGFSYLAGEILDEEEKVIDRLAPGSKHKIERRIQYGPSVPRDGGYQELMSDRVFRMIAKRHAPWRLDDGEGK
jgi:hypothetical protein